MLGSPFLQRLLGPSRGQDPGARKTSLRTRLGFVVICLAVVSTACASGTGQPVPPQSALGTPTATVPTTRTNPIVAENRYPGTTAWRVDPSKVATTQIQAYASALSVAPGDTLTFYVSVQQDGTPYTLAIYRLGWYGGSGSRLHYWVDEVGQAQGYYDPSTSQLVNCPTCRFDPNVDLVEADWRPSISVVVRDNWVTGVYVAEFTDANGMETTVQFDVRGDPTSTYVASTADTTVAAYNEWGGHSFYRGIGSDPVQSWNTRAKKVSLDRPVMAGLGRIQGLVYEIDAIRWLERQGYDVSYISSVDLHEHPAQLLTHRAYLSLGHDEYWSAQMRDGAQRARDAGVGLAFLGGNDIYWQIRFEPDSNGVADRTIVCYKDAGLDPLYQHDNAHLTIQWRDPLIGRPENALLGIMYSGNTSQPNGYPWYLDLAATSPLLAGTNLQTLQPYGCDMVGYEWDRKTDNGLTPAGLHILGTSPTVDVHHNTPDTSNTAYYIAPSGALVFAAGSLAWTFALDDTRLLPNPACSGQNASVAELQQLMANVMAALIH